MRSPDYEEFLESLNAHGVRYLIVGAHAVAFHGHPRATKDLDVFIEATHDNAERTLSAIREFFGGSDASLSVADLIRENETAAREQDRADAAKLRKAVLKRS